MRITVSVSIQADDDSPAVADDVFTCERTSPLSADTVGLHLDEAKAPLSGVQETMVAEQAKATLAGNAVCPSCGAARRHKDTRQIVVRTLFGVVRLSSPRWWQCGCTTHAHATVSPLAAMLPERATPELVYVETKFAALAAYGASAGLLTELLPLGRTLHATAIRFHAQAVARRLEDELGAEQAGFIDTCPAQWEELPRPDLPLVVGLDGGYVHSSQQRSRKDGWFEVIAGKVVPAEGKPTCFGCPSHAATSRGPDSPGCWPIAHSTPRLPLRVARRHRPVCREFAPGGPAHAFLDMRLIRFAGFVRAGLWRCPIAGPAPPTWRAWCP
jgi:hypothetical protein